MKFYDLLNSQMEHKFKTAQKIDALSLGVQDPLDDGISFVKLVEFWGSDDGFANAARTSYEGGKTVQDNERLVDYLMRHDHASPFEMGGLTLLIKIPLSTWGQFLRHRSMATFEKMPLSQNQQSYRYVEVKQEFYIPKPERVRLQAKNNKQASGDDMADEDAINFLIANRHSNIQASKAVYDKNIENGVAREVSREDIPQCVYTTIQISANFRALTTLLMQRLHSTAQEEIRRYAEAILNICRVVFPVATASWENHKLNAVTFSKQELEALFSRGIEDCVKNPPSKDFLEKIKTYR